MGDEWIVLRRYDDAIEAQIALDFLREHGVRVALQGNSGATSILNRFDTVLDIRLVVEPSELDAAKEALAALTPSDDQLEPEPPVSHDAPWPGSPYRASRGRTQELQDPTSEAADTDEPCVKRRYRRAAFILAFAIPIGSGHFYARHDVAGCLLALGIVAYFATGVVRGDGALTIAALLLVAFDAVLGTLAVRRHNEARVATPRAQALVAMGGAVAALIGGIALATTG